MSHAYARGLLFASATKTTSGTQIVKPSVDATLLDRLDRFKRATILLDVTAAAAAAGDTLNVYIQKNVGPAAAPVWHDFVSFTQVLGNGGAKQFVAQVVNELATTGVGAVKDAALAAGSAENGPWSEDWRVKWVIASASAPSFTFSISAHLKD
jgi:hypothetical protein